VIYKYRASETFWKNFHALTSQQKESVRAAWRIFKHDPFARSLGTHKIHSLSSLARRTVYSVVVEDDLRAVFYIDGDTIFTFDIGSHDVYRF
jgi:hypothetical protein